MRSISFKKECISDFLSKHTIATLDELKNVLGTNVSMTIFRKLKELNYLSSCSHRGKYYSLPELARFNNNGLWFYNSILFSTHGSLKKTIKYLTETSEQGNTINDFKNMLKLDPNESLLKLIYSKQLYRKKMNGVYVYFSSDEKIRKQQRILRNKSEKEISLKNITPDILMNELKAGIIIFYSTLNEKQRRLYAGLESLKLGKEGDKVISNLLGINIKTIAKGRKELLNNSVNIDTIRSPGGGRKKKK